MTATIWHWVRHGPTHQTAFTGWRDVPADLSDTAALSRLTTFLPTDAVVVSSDLKRAIATADAIQAQRPRLPHQPALREFNFGVWDGLHFDEVATRDPELSRAFWETPGTIAAPDGESWQDVANRVRPVVTELSAAHAGRAIIAVAHIGTIMTQIAAATGQTPVEVIAQKIDTLSVTSLRLSGGVWSMERVNHCP